MRKLIVVNIVSLDGFFAGPGQDVLALPFDNGFSEYNVLRLRNADTLLLGRRSFTGFQGYWPQVADNPDQPPVEREISRLNNTIEKVVISDTLSLNHTDPWKDAHVVKRADAVNAIGELKAKPGKDILTFGSHVMWNSLLTDGLVDELHLMVGPRLLGAGTPVFEGSAPIDLRLIEARVLDTSSLVLHRYAAA